MNRRIDLKTLSEILMAEDRIANQVHFWLSELNICDNHDVVPLTRGEAVLPDNFYIALGVIIKAGVPDPFAIIFKPKRASRPEHAVEEVLVRSGARGHEAYFVVTKVICKEHRND